LFFDLGAGLRLVGLLLRLGGILGLLGVALFLVGHCGLHLCDLLTGSLELAVLGREALGDLLDFTVGFFGLSVQRCLSIGNCLTRSLDLLLQSRSFNSRSLDFVEGLFVLGLEELLRLAVALIRSLHFLGGLGSGLSVRGLAVARFTLLLTAVRIGAGPCLDSFNDSTEGLWVDAGMGSKFSIADLDIDLLSWVNVVES